MGGNALLYAKTKRLDKEQYNHVLSVVLGTLTSIFPNVTLAPVLSIENKETFGDADILLVDRHLPDDWIAQVQDAFSPNEIMINRTKTSKTRASPLRFVRDATIAPEVAELHDGTHYQVPRERIPCSAISFEFSEFQIDLVVTRPENFEIAQVYYANNDLGNLMGRIADRMGFKYGWSGLWKHVGEGNEIYDTVLVTDDPCEIFTFLGYSFDRFEMGFMSFANMFEFAASTPWFHRAPYQFENRNHRDRIRDEKRKVYQDFVAWLEDKPWLDKHTWASYERNEVTAEREGEKRQHEKRAMDMFPQFSKRLLMARRARREENDAKKVWNGRIVGEITGLSGVLLGQFMNRCREYFSTEYQMHYSFDKWVSQRSPEEIKSFIESVMRVQA